MTSFAALKKQRGNFADISKKLNEGKQNWNDDRFWKLTVDKEQNGYAVIRFLPAPEGEEYPFIRKYSHSFKGPTGKWYIEDSLTTLGQPDPVSEHFFDVRGDGSDPAKREAARPFSRRTRYISNIYIVDDPKAPENNGKVFLFEYGPRIFEKIELALNPKFPDEKPINPFDLWEGANFKLKAHERDGQRSYDRSEFDSTSALLDDDSALEKIWRSQYSLADEVDPSKFKSYDELKTKFQQCLGGVVSNSRASSEVRDMERSFGTSPGERFQKLDAQPDTPAEEIDDPPWDTSDSDLDEYAELIKDLDI